MTKKNSLVSARICSLMAAGVGLGAAIAPDDAEGHITAEMIGS